MLQSSYIRATRMKPILNSRSSIAVELKPEQIIIIAALGGRLDQTLANITLLSGAPRLSTSDIRLDDGVEEIFFCRDQAEVHGQKRRLRLADSLAGRCSRMSRQKI